MEIEKLCRGCLREDDNMIDMFAKAIHDKFLLFANLIAEEEIPDIPLNLCRSCEQKLNNALDFKEKCQNSHEILLNYVKNTREVKIETTDADTHQVDSEAPTLLNNVKNTCEVDSEATVVTYVSKLTKKPLRLEQFSKYKVLEAIEELKQGFHKNTNCIHCSYVGKNSRALSVHIFRVHKKLKLRWCCLCNAEFDNLTDHVATNHKDDYTCKFCSKKFHNKGLLTEHLHGHSDVKRFPCSFCESSFVKKTHLNVHLRKHVKEEPFKCGSCDESFTQLHYLKTHLKTHRSKGDAVKQLAALKLKEHKRVPPSKSPHKCTYCNKILQTRSMMTEHIRTHTGEKPHVCQVCGKSFVRSSTLKTHMMIHNIGKKISCNICNKKFSRPCFLRIHMRRHTGDKPFVCNSCDKSFSQNSALKRHMLVHSENPFVCNECGKAFVHRSELIRHNRMHSDLRPHKCSYCDKTFKCSRTLMCHMWIHSGEKPYKCNQCSYACRQSYHLLLHMKKHGIDKPQADRSHVCLMCNKTFASDALLTYHIKTHTVGFLEI